MKRYVPLAVTLAVSLGAIATSAQAQAAHAHDETVVSGPSQAPGPAGGAGKGMGGMMDPAMMAMMQTMMGAMMAGGTGQAAVQGFDMAGGHMGASAMAMLDGNADGTIAPDEMDAGLASALGTYDADKNGTLSLAEFEAFHSALTRSRTVDRFQALDEDGDGQVTAAELAAPGKAMRRMAAMQGRSDANPAPDAATAPGQDGMDQDGMDQDGN